MMWEDSLNSLIDNIASISFLKIFIYFWLHWLFDAERELSLVVVSWGYSSLWCTGFSLQLLLLVGAQALGVLASVVVACMP